MPLKRLTKAQAARKAEELRPLLEPYAAETVRTLLEHVGVWERLRGQFAPAEVGTALTPEEQRRAVLAGLFEKARSGDASAARAFNDLLDKQQAAGSGTRPAAVVVQVVPFNVPDVVGSTEREAV